MDNGNSSEIQAKKEKVFYNGLSDRINPEMSRLNIHNIHDLFNVIHTTETKIQDQMGFNYQHNMPSTNNTLLGIKFNKDTKPL